MKDYYEILQISPNASDEVIKSAYKALVKKHHPDVVGKNTIANDEMIKDINEAYEVLMDTEKRLEYDMTLDMAKEEERYSNVQQNNEYDDSGYDEYERDVYSTYNNQYENINNIKFESIYKLIIFLVIACIILAVIYLMPLFTQRANSNSKPNQDTNVDVSVPSDGNEQPENTVPGDETGTNNEDNIEEDVPNNGYFQLGDSSKIVKAVMGEPDFAQQYSDVAYWYYGSSVITFDSNRNVIGWDNKGNLEVNQGEKTKNSTFALGSSQLEVVAAMGTPDKVDGGTYLSNWYYGDSQIAFDAKGNVWGWDNKGNLEVNQGEKVKNSTFAVGSSQSEVIKAMGTPDKVQDIIIFSYWYYGTSRITFDVNKNVSNWKQGDIALKINN